MYSLIIHNLTLYRPLGYFLIFVGLLIEGEFVLFTAAFLTQQGAFDIGDMFFVVILSVLVGDVLWYFAGTLLDGTNYRWQKWFNRLAKPFDHHLTENLFRTILISKFTYGFHRAILVRAGMLRIARGEFLKADTASAFLWIAIIGGLGYLASTSFLLVRHYLRFAEAGLVLGLMSFFLLSYFASRYFQKKL